MSRYPNNLSNHISVNKTRHEAGKTLGNSLAEQRFEYIVHDVQFFYALLVYLAALNTPVYVLLITATGT